MKFGLKINQSATVDYIFNVANKTYFEIAIINKYTIGPRYNDVSL